ncbi:unnamed protein product, partial [Didymodactylos carnosus]
IQLKKHSPNLTVESVRTLSYCLTELLKHGDQYSIGRCALLLAKYYLIESDDFYNPNEAKNLLCLSKDIFSCLHDTLYLKLTCLYLIFTYNALAQAEKRKQTAKEYRQIQLQIVKPVLI